MFPSVRIILSPLLLFWWTLSARSVGSLASSDGSSSLCSHPFSLTEESILDQGSLGSSRNNRLAPTKSRARIVEWHVSDEFDNLLPSPRRRRSSSTWEDDTELDQFPSLSDDPSNTMDSNENMEKSSVTSPFALQLHLEGRGQDIPEQHSDRRPEIINSVDDGNSMFSQEQLQAVKKSYKKTGTTIAGCCVNNHVLLAADTRATEGTMVADKTCQKLHQLATNSWCCGAGTSADLDHLTKECLYSLALQRLQESSIGNTESGNEGGGMFSVDGDDDEEDVDPLLLLYPASMDSLCNFLQDALYGAGGNLGANLILGGVWQGKAHLRAIHPHGSMDVDLPFAALGSGGLAAMGVMEQGYHSDITVEEGIELVQRAILAGIRNDLGSGSQVDLCIIRPDGTSTFQRCVVPEEELEEGFMAEETAESTDADAPPLGVNGFGNLPFAIQSRKLVMSSDTEKERLSSWNEVLGIDQQ